jgi:hypothetical protein
MRAKRGAQIQRGFVSGPRTLMYAGGRVLLKSISSERTIGASAFGADMFGFRDGSWPKSSSPMRIRALFM